MSIDDQIANLRVAINEFSDSVQFKRLGAEDALKEFMRIGSMAGNLDALIASFPGSQATKATAAKEEVDSLFSIADAALESVATREALLKEVASIARQPEPPRKM